MRRSLTFLFPVLLPVALAGFAIVPACAQRGGHMGGHIGGGVFPGRASAGFQGRPPAGLAPRTFAPNTFAPHTFVPRTFDPPRGPVISRMQSANRQRAFRMLGGRQGSWDRDGRGRHEGNEGRRHGDRDDRDDRRLHIFGYNTYLVPNAIGYPFGFCDPFSYAGFCDSFYGDDYDSGAPEDGDAAEPGNYAYPPAPAEEPESAEDGQPGAGNRPEYQSPGEAGSGELGPYEVSPSQQGPESPAREAAASEPARSQPATTLVFKDGRPTAQVHNYVLTATTLYALDNSASKEIPTSEIDIPATVKANRAAGVDFRPPT